MRTCRTTGRPSTTTSVMSRSAATVGLVLLGGARLTKCWHSRVLPTLHAAQGGPPRRHRVCPLKKQEPSLPGAEESVLCSPRKACYTSRQGARWVSNPPEGQLQGHVRLARKVTIQGLCCSTTSVGSAPGVPEDDNGQQHAKAAVRRAARPRHGLATHRAGLPERRLIPLKTEDSAAQGATCLLNKEPARQGACRQCRQSRLQDGSGDAHRAARLR